MARKTATYWEKRSTALMLHHEKNTLGTINKLVNAYNRAMENIDKEIKIIYRNYAKDGVLSKSVLDKLLNAQQSKIYHDNLLKTINLMEDSDVKKKLLTKYNAPAYASRISRFEELRTNIDIELKKMANIENFVTQEHYKNVIEEGYYRSIYEVQKYSGIGFDFSKIDNRTVNAILAEKWVDSSNFSERIWKNNEKLNKYLSDNLLGDYLSGKNVNKMSSELAETMNVGLYNATTLIRTETAHFANESEMLAYEELEIEKYRFIATLDNVTCKHCAELDNKVFSLKDRQAGKNYPPIHPNDRCTTVAEFDDDVTEGLQRRAKDENGKSIIVPQEMDYKEWKEKYVTNIDNDGIIKEQSQKVTESLEQNNDKQEIPRNINEFYDYISTIERKEEFITTESNENGYITGQRLNQMLGYDKLPVKVSNEEFEKLSKESEFGKLYRGISADTAERCQVYIDNFRNGKFYSGGQAGHIYGKGTYVGFGELGKNTAYNYSQQAENGQVIEMVLEKNAKTINYYELFKETNKEVDEFIKNHYQEYNIDSYMKLITNLNKIQKKDEFITRYIMNVAHDVGYNASIKGYDAIIANNELAGQKYIVILNRGKVIVSE